MTLTSRRFSALTLPAVLSAGALLAAQSQTPPVFRAEANLVEVIVRVTDENGHFVPHLTMKDFEIRDEGRLQSIVAFDRRTAPRTATPPPGAGRPILERPEMSTVATNEGAANARLFILLLDDCTTPPTALLAVRRTAREFVERYVGSVDLVAVFPTAGSGAMTQDFTTDKARVLRAVDRFMGSAPPGICGPRVVADVAETLASHLNGIRGRRISVVWIGATALDLGNHYERRAIEALRRANVTLYIVDPRRLYDRDVGSESIAYQFFDGTVAQTVPRWGEAAFGHSPTELREFAALVGGFAAVDTNEFAEAFDRILEESSEYYVLGFQPLARGRAGDFRQIQVRVPSRPKALVSARPGYVVSTSGKPKPRPTDVSPLLADALVNNLPTAGLPMRVHAIPRRGSDEESTLVHVVVEIAGRNLTFTQENGRHRTQVDFALRTIDFLARPGNNIKTTLTFNLTPEQFDGARTTGLRWLSTLNLRPGRYNLRVAGEAAGSNQIGGVFVDLDVPKYEDDQLWIASLAVTSRFSELAVTAGALPALRLPGPPTTARSFMKGDVMTIGTEVGVRRDFKQGAVQLTVHPQNAAKEAPALLTRTVELADRSAAEQPRAFAIDTAALGPGQFVLRLTVRDQEDRSADTAVLFEVVEQ